MPIVNYTPGRIRVFIEILLAILLIYLLLRTYSCNQPVPAARGTADSTLYWKNKYGEAVVSQRALPEQFSLQDQRIKYMLDSVARVYDTKTNRIQEMIIAISKGVSNLRPVPGTAEVGTAPSDNPVCPPVIKWMRQTFSNPYYLADARVGDSAYLVLQTYDTLTALWKTVKTGGLFNRKKLLQLDIHFADTSRVVTGLTSYRRLVTTKEFSIGPEARLLYLDREIRPLAGMSINRETGRWNISLSAGKDFTRDINIRTNNWYGEGRILFKLIRL